MRGSEANRKATLRTQWIEETLDFLARIESDLEDSDLLHALRPIAVCGFARNL